MRHTFCMGAWSCPEHRARFIKVKSCSQHRGRVYKNQKLVRASWENSESIQTDILDQSLNRNELAMAMLRNTVQPTGEQNQRVDARLHELHCNSGLCSNRTLADRLRRDRAPQSVCTPAMVPTCYACGDVWVRKTNCGVKLVWTTWI